MKPFQTALPVLLPKLGGRSAPMKVHGSQVLCQTRVLDRLVAHLHAYGRSCGAAAGGEVALPHGAEHRLRAVRHIAHRVLPADPDGDLGQRRFESALAVDQGHLVRLARHAGGVAVRTGRPAHRPRHRPEPLQRGDVRGSAGADRVLPGGVAARTCVLKTSRAALHPARLEALIAQRASTGGA